MYIEYVSIVLWWSVEQLNISMIVALLHSLHQYNKNSKEKAIFNE